MTKPAPREFVPRPAEGLAYPNVVAMFRARVERSAQQPALRFKRAGAWKTLSWKQWFEAAREMAAGLHILGVRRGDRCPPPTAMTGQRHCGPTRPPR